MTVHYIRQTCPDSNDSRQLLSRSGVGPTVAVSSSLGYGKVTESLCVKENGRSGVRVSHFTIYTISVVRHKSRLLCRCPRSELFVPQLNVITLITIKLSDHILGSYEERPSVQSLAERLWQTQSFIIPSEWAVVRQANLRITGQTRAVIWQFASAVKYFAKCKLSFSKKEKGILRV